jgi:hypothetical protein
VPDVGVKDEEVAQHYFKQLLAGMVNFILTAPRYMLISVRNISMAKAYAIEISNLRISCSTSPEP